MGYRFAVRQTGALGHGLARLALAAFFGTTIVVTVTSASFARTKPAFVALTHTRPKAQGWANLSPSLSPSPRQGPVMVYDTKTKQLILFGGAVGAQDQLSSDTWLWTGTTWQQLFPSTSPSPRTDSALAYDPKTRQVVLFGGAGNTWLADTWVWNGQVWALSPASGPVTGCDGVLAFDPATRQLVLLDPAGQTWLWNGSDWTKASAMTSPNGSCGAALVYDPPKHQMILFAGFGNGSSLLSQTWMWTGTNWKMLHPSHSPTPRGDEFMGYSPRDHALVLYGGVTFMSGQTKALSDTWLWNGSDWVETFPISHPNAQAAGAMTFDKKTKQLLLFGGYSYQLNASQSQTWLWSG
jgi:hypothetical protein